MFLRHFIFRRVVTETCTHFSIFHTNRMYTPLLNAIRRVFAKSRYHAWLLASPGVALFLIAFLQNHPKKQPKSISDRIHTRFRQKSNYYPCGMFIFQKLALTPLLKSGHRAFYRVTFHMYTFCTYKGTGLALLEAKPVPWGLFFSREPAEV